MKDPRTEWASAQWREKAQEWIDLVLRTYGVQRTGPVEQPNINFWSTQLTVPTDHGRFWFKENNLGQFAEASIMSLLGELAPDHVAAPLAIEPSRGWMLTVDHGPTLATATEDSPAVWARVVGDFAELQKRVSPHGDRFSQAGLVIMNPEVAANFVENQLLLHTGVPPEHPMHLSRQEADDVRRRLPAVNDAVDLLRAVPVPLSLDHYDLHARNCFLPPASTAPLRYFDFADSYWAHPFSALLVPITQMREQWGTTTDDPRIRSVISAYLEPWTDHAPQADLLGILEPALKLAGIHRYGSWLRLLVYADDRSMRSFAPKTLRYLRTLMDPVLD